MIGGGTPTTQSRVVTGWATKTPSTTCVNRPLKLFLSLNHTDSPFPEPKKGKFIREPSEDSPNSTAKSKPIEPAQSLIGQVTPCCIPSSADPSPTTAPFSSNISDLISSWTTMVSAEESPASALLTELFTELEHSIQLLPLVAMEEPIRLAHQPIPALAMEEPWSPELVSPFPTSNLSNSTLLVFMELDVS